MASKKNSPPTPSSSWASQNRWKGSYSSGASAACTILTSLLHLALLQQVLFFLLTLPSPTESILPPKNVTITNNHTKVLTVRCFTFYDEDSVRTKRVHLKPNQSYSFLVVPHRFYPSSTMYNCSTNMGVFVAYKYDYRCSMDPDPMSACEWMFDERQTYLKVKDTWKVIDYHPNYESLGRGGVVKGYFTN